MTRRRIDPNRETDALKRPSPASMSLTTTLSRRLQNVASSWQRAAQSTLALQRSTGGSTTRSVAQQDEGDFKEHLRILFRNIAQPVAVVTSFMPRTSSDLLNDSKLPKGGVGEAETSLSTHRFHGATLSSFTSIAMDPYPLVTFALRIPSRMAATLSSVSPLDSAHMVVNLLSTDQVPAAIAFSRADLHPKPFETCGTTYRLSKEGLPILDGVLGALSCKVVGRGIPLHDLDHFGVGNGVGEQGPPTEVVLKKGDVASELFIARVVRVEAVEERTMPLIYHKRRYTTCSTKS